MSRNSLRIFSALFIASAALLLAGCAQETIGEIAPPQQTQAQATVITAEPTVTYSLPQSMPLPAGQDVPAGYTAIASQGGASPLFAFTDESGAVCYRVYGGYIRYADGVETERTTGFYRADAQGVIEAEKDEFVDPAKDAFGVCTAMDYNGLMRLRDGFSDTEQTGVCVDASGKKYVFGSFGEDAPAFYPASESGSMIAGALQALDIALPAYLPTLVPAAEGERLLVVYIGSQTVVSYIAKDGEWTQERLMICSTGRKEEMTPRGEYGIVRQYLYKKMGEVQGENVYSQYASRITGSYLFHSVPIGGDKRYSPEYGKKQMFIKYYEQLGEPASGGCVRLLCADAFWIYTTCEVGTRIWVSDDVGPAAPETPALIYEEPYMDRRGEYGWDPTDPDPENPYHAIYQPEFVRDDSVRDKSDD